jgi:alpha-L-fucosidase
VCPAISEFGLYAEPVLDAGSDDPGAHAAPARKRKWKVVSVSGHAPKAGRALHAIDGNPRTLWHTATRKQEIPPPQEIVVDMGETVQVAGFSCLPRQDGNGNGIVDRYAFYLSTDGTTWGDPAAEGEFANVLSNPVLQEVTLSKPARARYFKFVARSVVRASHVTVAELDIQSP